MRIAVFISGSGSNLQAIIDAVKNKWLDVEIAGVISNKADAYGLERAKAAGIPAVAFQEKRATFEAMALTQLNEWGVDCLVLAGFMRVLSPEFIDGFTGIMINVHPSILPKHKGLDTHQRAIDEGDTHHGCSVHFVTAELDSGKVIAQNILPILENDTAESLQQRIHPLEHWLLPRVVGWLADQRFHIADNVLYLDQFPLQKPLQFFEMASDVSVSE